MALALIVLAALERFAEQTVQDRLFAPKTKMPRLACKFFADCRSRKNVIWI